MNVEQPAVVIAPRPNWTFGTALRFVFPLNPKLPADLEARVERIDGNRTASPFRGLSLSSYQSRMTGPDGGETAEGEDYPTADEAAKAGILAATDCAKGSHRRG